MGWTFGDPALLERALTHRSWCAENPGTRSNERLEFLGDAVLGMVITDQLIKQHVDRSEGWLSRARSSLVRAGTLYAIALEIDLGVEMRLGKGEERTGGRTKPSILADAVEALFGAIHLDGGVDAAQSVILGLYARRLEELPVADDLDEPIEGDYKSRLQELCAQGGGSIPTYRWTDEGPEHEKTFTIEVVLDGNVLARGSGRSKKRAEQSAAAQAIHNLNKQESE